MTFNVHAWFDLDRRQWVAEARGRGDSWKVVAARRTREGLASAIKRWTGARPGIHVVEWFD
jgi:hypothetical protein